MGRKVFPFTKMVVEGHQSPKICGNNARYSSQSVTSLKANKYTFAMYRSSVSVGRLWNSVNSVFFIKQLINHSFILV